MRQVPTLSRANRWPALFATATILGQISWILVPSQWRTPLTVATVVTFFLCTATHAWTHRGPRWAVPYLTITLAFGWAVEAVGTRTGQPFGEYHYTGALGPALASVPLVIPLAWSMMAYPCLLAAQRLAQLRFRGSRIAAIGIGGWCLAAWDLFLDPQMVTAGYWVWEQVGFHLPGISDIPAHNFAGWLAVALLLMTALSALPQQQCDDTVPTIMLSWVYLSNVMAAAVFFARPGVALWGALAMGLVVVPWWATLDPARRRIGARA